jgi:hypothetical protein
MSYPANRQFPPVGHPPNPTQLSSPSAGYFKIENNGFYIPRAVNWASHWCLGWKEQLTGSAADDLTVDEEKYVQAWKERDQINLQREISCSMTS